MGNIKLLLVCILVLYLIIFTSNTSKAYSGGSGTEEDPYLISTVQDLYDIRDNPSAYFNLTNDIDLNVSPYNIGNGWNILPTFSGTLDGKGFVIKNLYINSPEGSGRGLFNHIDNGRICNIALENVNVCARVNCGGLSGGITNSELEKIYVTGKVKSTNISGDSKAGLITGYFGDASIIKNSYVIGTTICNTDPHRTGIAIGEVNTADALVENVYAIGTTNGDGSIAGVFQSDTTIRNCIGLSNNVSLYRIALKNFGGIFTNNYGYSDMYVNGNKDVVPDATSSQGENITYEQFRSLSDLKLIVGKNAPGVINGWDFDNVWEFKPSAIRPTLKGIGNDSGLPISSEPFEDLQEYRSQYRYYIGKDYNGVVRVMLVSGDGKTAPTNINDILDSEFKFKLGIYYIDKSGNVKIY